MCRNAAAPQSIYCRFHGQIERERAGAFDAAYVGTTPGDFVFAGVLLIGGAGVLAAVVYGIAWWVRG
jgi:hypothetical protein